MQLHTMYHNLNYNKGSSIQFLIEKNENNNELEWINCNENIYFVLTKIIHYFIIDNQYEIGRMNKIISQNEWIVMQTHTMDLNLNYLLIFSSIIKINQFWIGQSIPCDRWDKSFDLWEEVYLRKYGYFRDVY